MTSREGVFKTTFHQCMHGLEGRDKLGSAPAYKPTSVLTNHSALAEALQTKCAGGRRHVQLVGKQACSRAAVYPPGLCSAGVKGGQVIKKKRVEYKTAMEKAPDSGWESRFTGLPREDVLF